MWVDVFTDRSVDVIGNIGVVGGVVVGVVVGVVIYSWAFSSSPKSNVK